MTRPEEKDDFKYYYTYVHREYTDKELDDYFGYHDLESYKIKLLDDRDTYEIDYSHFLNHDYDLLPEIPEYFVMYELIQKIEHNGETPLEQAIYNAYLAHKLREKYEYKYCKMPPQVRGLYKQCLSKYFEIMSRYI